MPSLYPLSKIINRTNSPYILSGRELNVNNNSFFTFLLIVEPYIPPEFNM